MISEQDKKWITSSNFSPYVLSFIHTTIGCKQEEVFAYVDDQNSFIHNEKKRYFAQREILAREIKEFVAEFSDEFKKECSERHNKEQTEETKIEFEQECVAYAKDGDTKRLPKLQGLEKTLKSLKENVVTPDMIVKAREYPLSDLVQTNKKLFALCPFHTDTKPSLYIKNNFYHCFACQETGDVIDFYMKKNNANFVTAVTYLSTH